MTISLSNCRRDISLVSNPPIGMSFGPWNISQSLPVKGATTNVFLFGFTEILLSKSAPNLDALIPLYRARSYDPNDPTFTFIPILEGEIRNLPVLCLHTLAGLQLRFKIRIIPRSKGIFKANPTG